jgi:RecJ-like exonuclease
MRGFSERPRFEYRGIRDWITKRFRWEASEEKLKDPSFWPCVECGGRGKVRHEEDRDIIEGYKLAPWHTCAHCNGTGRWLKAQVKVIYQKIVQEFRAKLACWKEQDGLRKSAFKKLTKEEVKALGL